MIMNYIQNLKQIYIESYDVISTRINLIAKNSTLNLSELSAEDIINILFRQINTFTKLKKICIFYVELYRQTIGHYSDSFYIEESEYPDCNNKRYLVTYNDELSMFISNGKFIDNIIYSEHIFISRLPSLILSSYFTGIREPNIAPLLHLYGLKLFRPNYVLSAPLDIMDSIFNRFEQNGLFIKSNDLDKSKYLGDSYEDYEKYELLFNPTIEYCVNLECLDELLLKYNFKN